MDELNEGPFERIDIKDDVTWGRLVKTWSTGVSKLPNRYLPRNYPRTLGELHVQCIHAKRPNDEIQADGSPKPNLPTPENLRLENPLLTIPEEITGLAVLQYSPRVLSLRLPPKLMVEEAEKQIKENNVSYPIPQFYNDFYQTELANKLTDPGQKLDFHACRIGDYSVRNCG
jgi:hypothetical protein